MGLSHSPEEEEGGGGRQRLMSITDTNMLHLLQYYIPQHPHSKNNSESSIAVRHDNDSTMSKCNKYLILHKDPSENRNNNRKKALSHSKSVNQTSVHFPKESTYKRETKRVQRTYTKERANFKGE